MRGRRAVAGFASLVIAAGLLAAVVPTSAGADVPSQQFPPVDQPGVTGTEINVGGVVTKSNNPTGGTEADAFAGVKAYFEMVNSSKAKGIYGRKLKLTSERDDALGMNTQEVQGLISNDNVFAVLPVDVLLFTGGPLLSQSGIPTFGWNINAEWGSEKPEFPGAPNMFGQRGSYTCFTCPSQTLPWLAKQLKKTKVGVLAYTVDQSKDCAKGIKASFDKYPPGKIVFDDESLSFGADFSTDVSQMKDKGVNLVATCMDINGTLTLAKEMKKQGLDAIQYLPNAYDQEFMKTNGQFFEGSYVLTFFTPYQVKKQPPGLKQFLKWAKKTDSPITENALAGWTNADLFYQGLKAAGPEFTRQKVIDAINQMKDYTANGIYAPIDWTISHTADSPQGCVILSKIHNGTFVPSFGTADKPFICFQQGSALPDKLQSKPTLLGTSG
jgi:branched-chain amino acid transport system substrate-binding protein